MSGIDGICYNAAIVWSQPTMWTLPKSSTGTAFDNQMWSADFGVLP